MLILRLFICFCPSHCDSQCESQKLNALWNINYQSHLSHKCHDTNYVNVCCNMFKTLDRSKVWYSNVSSSFMTHIVRDQSRWIPFLIQASMCRSLLFEAWKSKYVLWKSSLVVESPHWISVKIISVEIRKVNCYYNKSWIGLRR